MDMNDYTIGHMVRARLDDLRAEAAVRNAAAVARPASRPLRVTLGLALIRLGRLAVGDDRRRSFAPRPS
jgi:hypothetical protein